MVKFSANLGFLWRDRPIADAIRAAKNAGFDAVECHWPYEYRADDIKAALDETGLVMLGINTRPGNIENGDNGLAALPGRGMEAKEAIDEAIDYARKIGTPNIHVMAGFGQGVEAEECFVENLHYASQNAQAFGINILIEPLNHYDAPGYFLQTTSQAKQIIDIIGKKNLKLMFDCYHVQIMEGDLTRRLEELLPIIGHIQFASVPERGAPDIGEINFTHLFQNIDKLGYAAPLGAEYKPSGNTDASLDWLREYRGNLSENGG